MNVKAAYFSATGTTKKVVERIAGQAARNLNGDGRFDLVDFTSRAMREKELSFAADDLVIIGTPIYAGRVPNVLLNYLKTIRGNGAAAVCIVLYGNRNFDDGLIELRDIMDENGFRVIAAGAFVGEHSFSTTLAAGRPDEEDMALAEQLADRVCEKLKDDLTGSRPGKGAGKLPVKGEEPYRKYYMPKDLQGNPVDIRKVMPKTNSDCKKCKLCAEICPMGSIDYEDTSKLTGICIKCGACIKKCPCSAKYYDDEGYLRHKYELEEQFKERKAPELFV